MVLSILIIIYNLTLSINEITIIAFFAKKESLVQKKAVVNSEDLKSII